MKKILYISPFAHVGGGEVSLLLILKHLEKKVYTPHLICYSDGPFVERAQEALIDTRVLKYTTFISGFFVVWGIFKYIKKERIELVHVNSLDIRAAIASRLAGVPCVGHLRVVFPFSWRDRLFVRISKKVIAVSYAVVKALCGDSPKLRNKFIVIPNAVEPAEAIKADAVKRQFAIPEGTRIVGAVGRIDPLKGYEYFIESASLIKRDLPDVNFFIVGGVSEDNPEQKKYLRMLKSKSEELGLTGCVHFTGFREDVLTLMSAFDVLVAPSVELKKTHGKIAEGFGRVVVEAMALGVPVVASDSGGLREIIEDGISGILVPPAEPVAISRAVLDLLGDTTKRSIIIKKAKDRFNSLYSADRHIAAIEKVYREILSIHQCSPCDACGGEEFKIKENCGEGYRVLQCSNCGFTFVYPKPCNDLIHEFYNEDYYKPWIEQQRKRRIGMWKKRVGIVNSLLKRKGKLLDIGCAEGLFLELAREDGWEVTGTEISPFAAKYTREKLGVTVFEGEFSDKMADENKFDAITMWHVLEHTRQPLETLRGVRKIIKDDGVLILGLPNLDNKVYQIIHMIMKGKSPNLFSLDNREPHLVFFNPQTIRLILNRSGFEVISISRDCGCIRLKERLLNILSGLFYLVSGRMYFDALEVHARPRA